MKDTVIEVICVIGCLAIFLASVGIVRFPDFFTRTHAATKASAFGLVMLFVAICVDFPQANVIAKSAFALLALFLTLPVASQALADSKRKSKRDSD